MYLGYYRTEDLPFKIGQKVTIPKGTPIHYTKDKVTRISKKTITVTINHMMNGVSVRASEYSDFIWPRSSSLELHPEVDTPLGKSRAVENPKIVWAGSGGYWNEVDVNELLKDKL